MQTSADEPNVHFSFRRLHSQQLRVPFRTFLRFGEGSLDISKVSAILLISFKENEQTSIVSTGSPDQNMGPDELVTNHINL